MVTARIALHADGKRVQGNERQLALVAAGLIERGHELHVAARPETDTWHLLAGTGAEMFAARARGAADLLSLPRLASWLGRIRPDALLLTSWRRLPVLGVIARNAGIPNVVLRVGMTHDVAPGLGGLHYRLGLRHLVHRVWVNSTTVRDHLVAAAGLQHHRVHLVPNAVALRPSPPAELRHVLGIPDRAPIIAAVGGLSHRKGFDVLIRAAACVPDAHVVICGTGDAHASLDRLSRQVGVAHRVHMLGQCADAPSVLAAADMFVLCSRAEGFSVAMMEAMLLGLPVVATDVGGVRDALLAHGGLPPAGWIVPPDDAATLAGVMSDVLAHLQESDVRARAAEAARRATHDYTPTALARNAERVLLGGRVRRDDDAPT